MRTLLAVALFFLLVTPSMAFEFIVDAGAGFEQPGFWFSEDGSELRVSAKSVEVKGGTGANSPIHFFAEPLYPDSTLDTELSLDWDYFLQFQSPSLSLIVDDFILIDGLLDLAGGSISLKGPQITLTNNARLIFGSASFTGYEMYLPSHANDDGDASGAVISLSGHILDSELLADSEIRPRLISLESGESVYVDLGTVVSTPLPPSVLFLLAPLAGLIGKAGLRKRA